MVAEARRTAAQLPILTDLLPSGFFKDIERRIKAEVDARHSVKLPVAFFVLVRRPAEALTRLDAILERLRQTGQTQGLSNLVERLLDPSAYRQATGALFELDILGVLLENARLSGVPYPRVPGTQKKAEARIELTGRPVYVEATVITQTDDQERLQDLSITSAYRPLTFSEEREAEELGATIDGGVASGTGRPYNEAYRVILKLLEKQAQLAADAPNVICLGIADPEPHGLPVAWGVRAVFCGVTTALDVLINQIERTLAEQGPALGAEEIARAQTFLTRVKEVKQQLVAERRITAVAVYRWRGDGFEPDRIYRNPKPGSGHALDEDQWMALAAALGFPAPEGPDG